MKKSRARRVFFAGLFHETHTFLGGQTTLADCTILDAAQIREVQDATSPLGGALGAARELGWQIIPSLDLRIMPGPMVADAVVDFWWDQVEKDLKAALEKGLDGVFLVLHGAMVSESLPDVEGELLERLRTVIGPEVPIAGVTDLHANFSRRMAQNSHALVTYRENPHIDGALTAERAALLLDFLMSSGECATTEFLQLPIIWPPTGTGTADEPMRALEQMARQIEAADAEILAINVHAGFAFADVEDCGVSFSAITVGSPQTTQQALKKLGQLATKERKSGNVTDPSFKSILPSLRTLLREGGSGPIVITEPSDNIGGGAPGDGTGLLRAFIEHQIGRSAVVICDESAVERLQNFQPGQTIQLEMGGKNTLLEGAGPLEIEIEFLERSDGHFTLEDPQSHLATMFGQTIDMGPCATVRHMLPGGEGILILLTSRKMPPFDLGQLRSQGIVPEKMAVIGVKAAVAHRRAYDPIARQSFAVSTPGPCSSDLKTLPYRHVRRPVFPLDK